MSECTEQQFISDIAKHQMHILRDEGVYRHLRFKALGTGIMQFDLITWPGSLCYTGDMGSYLFQRTEDMFRFFRADQIRTSPRMARTLFINPGYWSEKLQAVDRGDGFETYSPDRFRRVINERLDDVGASDSLRADVEDGVLCHADDGEYAARQAVEEYNNDHFQFSGFWEERLQDYTYRFIWCCYALAWGIKEYDKECG